MLDVKREHEILCNTMNRYKTKKLGFECGCVTGVITKINLIEDPYMSRVWRYAEDAPKAIEVRGIAGMDSNERVLAVITERWKRGKQYKYWRKYHILEVFDR